MNTLQVLYFVWTGFYGHVLSYLKQSVFQGQDMLKAPWKYLNDPKFVFSAGGILAVGFGTWVADAFIRQEFHLSQVGAYGTLIGAPISIVSTFVILKMSEQYLADKIVWWAAALYIVGSAVSMIGAYFMLRGHV